MTATRALALLFVVVLPSAIAEGRRPDRTLLYPNSLALSGASITVSADGDPHILYPSRIDWLRHAWREDGRWRDEPVEDEISTCARQSIAVDSLGRAHIAYTTGYLMYGVRSDSGWQLTQVAPTISDTAIAFRPGDQPALLHDAPDLNLELLYLEDGVWTVQDTGLTGFVDNRPSLAFDANGVGHMLFYRDLTLYHATDASGTWTETALSGVPYLRASLALDPQGRPHVAVGNGTTGPHGGLFHHWNNGSGWQVEDIVPPGDSFPGRFPSGIHVGSAGHPVVAYTEAIYIGSNLRSYPRFAFHDGLRWREGYSRRAPDVTVTSSDLDLEGRLHMVCPSWDHMQHMSFSLPDVEAEWDTVSTTPAGAGLRAKGALRILNLGAARSRPTRIRYLLSDDDRPDEGDEPVGTRRLDSIRTGRERRIAVSILLPVSASGRYLLAVVDPDERRDDLDRPNNTASIVLGE